jgi:hypothetical protein
MADILYLNHERVAQLIAQHIEVDRVLKHHCHYEWAHYWNTQDVFVQSSRYSRSNHNPWPFKNHIAKRLDWLIPEMPSSGLEFAAVTDARTHELMKLADGRPWIINWSGGIDSTVIIAAVLKNVEPKDRQEFVVCCNYFSIWENPVFFRDFVQPNFKIIDSTNRPDAVSHPGYLWLDGGVADNLWGAMLRYYCRDIHVPWRKNIHALVDLFVDRGASESSAVWMVDLVAQQIQQSGLQIDTTDQFLWWHNFNNGWITTLMRVSDYQTEINFFDLIKHSVCWYDTVEYQSWSMHHNISQPPDEIYKKAARRYIFDIDPDTYALHFKTKFASNSRNNNFDTRVIAVLNDGSFVLQNDWQKLCELLPAHLENPL